MSFSRAFAPVLLVIAVLGSNSAFAQGRVDSEWLSVDADSGLITVLSKPSTQALISQLVSFRAGLASRLTQLTRKVDKKRLDVKDGLITLVMPGGLLYAAYRTHEHQQAADRLAAVDIEMGVIGEDIAQLSIPVDGAVVALADPTP